MIRRRYEILLPSRYNDGRSVMEVCMTCVTATLGQVLDRFGAFTYTPQAVQGSWTDGGVRYDEQIEIYVTASVIEVI